MDHLYLGFVKRVAGGMCGMRRRAAQRKFVRLVFHFSSFGNSIINLVHIVINPELARLEYCAEKINGYAPSWS